MTWFENLTGFQETSPQHVRDNLELNGETLRSRVNGRSFRCGRLEVPSLEELRNRLPLPETASGRISVTEALGNVDDFHCDPENADALFQAASQFNLLEMVHPGITPEMGVGIYEFDPTQGPACAIACGAGTIYRNYFAEVNGRTGQTADNQIDCLAGLGDALGNADGRLWSMRNGYALASREGLERIARKLSGSGEDERERLKGSLHIGLQWDAEVTFRDAGHLASQAYCSALPVAYTDVPASLWEPFARLILEAAYEATLYAAWENFQRRGNPKAFLTLVGGGAFGNRMEWIAEAAVQALRKFEKAPLEIAFISRSKSNPAVQDIAKAFEK